MKPDNPSRRAWLAAQSDKAQHYLVQGLMTRSLVARSLIPQAACLSLLQGALPGANAASSEPHEDIPQPGRPLRFPRDFGAHPGTRIEWWYVTGLLRTAGGSSDPYGFQITFFRSRTAQADRQPASASRLAPRHLLFAHAALTDVKAGRLLHAERLARWNGQAEESSSRGITSSTQAARHDTQVRIGAWQLQRQGPADASIYEGSWQDDDAGFGLSLRLQASQPVLLQGQDGYSRKSPRPGHASGYYSQPQLRAQGLLQLQGRRMEVQGTAWLDHEWSSALLDPDAVGWDWLGLNLDDGRALTVFRLRRADGTTLWAGGSVRQPGQAVRPFAPHEVQMRPGRTWRSAATDAVYPVQWSLATPAGEHTVQALVDAQELDNRQRTGTVYWEGLSSVHDASGQRIGFGYLEMTGYAGRLQL